VGDRCGIPMPGRGSEIRLGVWLSRVGGRDGGGVCAGAQRCARGGLSIRRFGSAFLLVRFGLLAAMVVLLL